LNERIQMIWLVGYASCNNDWSLRFNVILQWNIKLLFTFKCLYIHDCNKISNTYHKIKSSYNSNKFFQINIYIYIHTHIYIYILPKKSCLISKWNQCRNNSLTWKSVKYKTIKLSHKSTLQNITKLLQLIQS